MSPVKLIRQAAAIPLHRDRICVINSSNNRDWVVPKGKVEPGDTIRETALKEAWEEAGLEGYLEDRPLGSYRYEKNGGTYHVTVFLMHVTEMGDGWPEDHRRERRWMEPADAEQLIQQPGLRRILARLATYEASVG